MIIKKYKAIGISIISLFVIQQYIYAQKKEWNMQDSIPKEIKEDLSRIVTYSNLSFLAFKNPNIPDSNKYITFNHRIHPTEVLGIYEKLGENYSFIFDIKKTSDYHVYLLTKKNNCITNVYYEDKKKTKPFKRDTICFDLDSALFPFDKRFLVYYNPNVQIGYLPYIALAGNLEINDDAGRFGATHKLLSDAHRFVSNRIEQFKDDYTGVGYITVSDTCNYFLFETLIPAFSSKPVKIKTSKKPPYRWIEIEFYTNNRKYSKDSSEYGRTFVKVYYKFNNDLRSIKEWHPTITKLSYREMGIIQNDPIESKFLENIIYKTPKMIDEDKDISTDLIPPVFDTALNIEVKSIEDIKVDTTVKPFIMKISAGKKKERMIKFSTLPYTIKDKKNNYFTVEENGKIDKGGRPPY